MCVYMGNLSSTGRTLNKCHLSVPGTLVWKQIFVRSPNVLYYTTCTKLTSVRWKKKGTNKNNVCFTKMPSYRCIIRKKEKCSLTLELHLWKSNFLDAGVSFVAEQHHSLRAHYSSGITAHCFIYYLKKNCQIWQVSDRFSYLFFACRYAMNVVWYPFCRLDLTRWWYPPFPKETAHSTT